MQQLPLFPELEVHPRERALSDFESLRLIERVLTEAQRVKCRRFLARLWDIYYAH